MHLVENTSWDVVRLVFQVSYKKYFYSGNIVFKLKEQDLVQNSREILKRLEKRYKNGEISKIDGIRIDFPDWWFILRPSNTEPFLKLIVEAKSRKLMLEKKKKLGNKIIERKKLMIMY